MSILDEIEEEDLRFRGAIKSAAYECEGDVTEVVQRLTQESKERQRAIFRRHYPEATAENREPVFPQDFPNPYVGAQ